MSWLNYIPAKKKVLGGLKLTFDSIVNVPVADAMSISDWNTFFDLPTNGTAFTSVSVSGNEVELIGGGGIALKDSLFDIPNGANIVKFIDTIGCIIAIGYNTFGDGVNEYGCYALTEVNLPEALTMGGYNFSNTALLSVLSLPKISTTGDICITNCNSLTSVSLPLLDLAGSGLCFNCTFLNSVNLPLVSVLGDSCFYGCGSLLNVYLPSLISMGSTTGANNLFYGVTGKTITLTIPSALMTCNGGLPDGDIAYLQANNTVTVITV